MCHIFGLGPKTIRPSPLFYTTGMRLCGLHLGILGGSGDGTLRSTSRRKEKRELHHYVVEIARSRPNTEENDIGVVPRNYSQAVERALTCSMARNTTSVIR